MKAIDEVFEVDKEIKHFQTKHEQILKFIREVGH